MAKTRTDVLVGTLVRPSAPVVATPVRPVKAAPEATVVIVTAKDRQTAPAVPVGVAVKVAKPARRPKGAPAAPKVAKPRPMTRKALGVHRKEALARLRAEAAALPKPPPEKPAPKSKPVAVSADPPLPVTVEDFRRAVASRHLSPGEAAIFIAHIEGRLPMTLVAALNGWRTAGVCPVDVPTELRTLAAQTGGVMRVNPRGAVVRAPAFGYRPAA